MSPLLQDAKVRHESSVTRRVNLRMDNEVFAFCQAVVEENKGKVTFSGAVNYLIKQSIPKGWKR